MPKSSKKKAREEIIRHARLKRQQEIWNPDISFRELVDFQTKCVSMIRELNRVERHCSYAHTRHGEPRARCHVGGAALMSNENWPTVNGKPLTLVIEIFIEDLPYIPPVLEGEKLFQVFMELDADGAFPSFHNGAWEVRTYKNLEGLKPISKGPELDGFNVSWSQVKTTPSYPDNIEHIDRKIEDEFNELPNWSEMAVEICGCGFGGLRVGGWPSWLQGSEVGDFALQIEGEFVNIDMGHDGLIFIGKKEGQWCLEWEIG